MALLKAIEVAVSAHRSTILKLRTNIFSKLMDAPGYVLLDGSSQFGLATSTYYDALI
jgi:hypothetical protein